MGRGNKLFFDFWKKRVVIKKSNTAFSITLTRKPETTKGITSRCNDGKHVLFIDYDFTDKSIVLDELKHLQQKHSLTPFYLFESSENSYHAISLTKLNFSTVLDILSETSCDHNYKSMPRRTLYNSWVLRTASKKGKPLPAYKGIVGLRTNLWREVSTAHLKVLQALYDVDHIDYLNLDGKTKVFTNTYET